MSLDAILDPLSDGACNAHLAVFIVDALLLTIFPEMGVEGTSVNSDGDGMSGDAFADKGEEGESEFEGSRGGSSPSPVPLVPI